MYVGFVLRLSVLLPLMNRNPKWNFINNHFTERILDRAIDYVQEKQACVWMQHEGHVNAIRRRAPCGLWIALMSQCHVHSHLSLMSRLLRQQVVLVQGGPSSSTFIHPSVLPIMPVNRPPQPPFSFTYPPLKHKSHWNGDKPYGIGSKYQYHPLLKVM